MLLKPHSFEFDEYSLDTNEKVLLRRGIPVSITPKVYDLLYFLISNHNHLVEKDAIMDEVWAGSFVEDSNLTFTIRQLRKILDDDARNPKFIETIPRRGYRFIAEVSEVFSDTNGHSKDFLIDDKSNLGKPAVDNPPSKKYSIQRALLLIITIGVLVVFGTLSMNSLTGNDKSVLSKKLNIKTLKTNGKSLDIAISPDGKYFAFTDESNEKESLWLQNIETSEKRQILRPDDVYYFGLTFSSDGNSIYFVRRRQTGTFKADIYKVSTSGGIPEKIIEHAEGWISLSPDDKLISFVRADENSNYSLYSADSDGRNEQKIIAKQNPERIGANQFSPDGKSIAYATGQSSTGGSDFRLMKIDLDSKIETKISKRDFFVIKYLSWMPNGKDLLFVANEPGENNLKLCRISTKTGKTTKLTEDAAKYSDMSLDKAGKNLLVTQSKNSFQVSLSSIANPNKKRILASANTAAFISDSEIAYSTSDGDLWKIATDGKRQQQLTTTNSLNNSPLISSDGRTLFFTSNRSGSAQIWRMDLDGSNKARITKKVGGIPKSISYDRKQIFFESTLYNTIWKVSAGGEKKEKEIWDRKLFSPVFSYDGTKIAYLHYDELKDRQLDIEISDLEDKSLIRKISLTEKGMSPVNVAWLNDNETLLYITRNEFGYKLWKQKINSDSPQFIADLGKERISDFSVSPNGKNFLVVSGEWLEDVILIKGFS